jgi:hypothetical protein
MNTIRCAKLLAALVLLRGLTPVWSQGKVLVPGKPALTQAMLDLDIASIETLLDLPFSDDQRRQYRRLSIEEWRARDEVKKRVFLKNLRTWSGLPTYSAYQRGLLRGLYQRKFLDLLVNPEASRRQRWLLALYQSACKPGSSRNPVLVDGDLPLTQLFVDRYRDYLEALLGLSVSGGFNAGQRQYLVKDWKRMSAEEVKDMVSDLKDWSDAVAEGAAAANKSIGVLRPRLLARLQTTENRESSRWLLEIVAQERKKNAALSAAEQKRHEAVMRLLGNLRGSGGSWRYDALKNRYDWVPGR